MRNGWLYERYIMHEVRLKSKEWPLEGRQETWETNIPPQYAYAGSELLPSSNLFCKAQLYTV